MTPVWCSACGLCVLGGAAGPCCSATLVGGAEALLVQGVNANEDMLAALVPMAHL